MATAKNPAPGDRDGVDRSALERLRHVNAEQSEPSKAGLRQPYRIGPGNAVSYWPASQSVASLRPSGKAVGSSKQRDQPGRQTADRDLTAGGRLAAACRWCCKSAADESLSRLQHVCF